MYRCNISYYSQAKQYYYHYGNEITETELMGLPEGERRHFIKSRTGASGSSSHNATPLSRFDDTPSFPSQDYGASDSSSSSSSDSSSSDFGGFSGGDTGGGGASGDW